MVSIEDAKTVAKSLARQIDPIAVVAFGSVARSGTGADLDLLVVTENDENESVTKVLRRFHRRFAVDHFVATRSTLRKLLRDGSPFLRLIQREGKVLYMKAIATQWVGLARDDLKQADYLAEGGFFRGACFSAQQAAEKAIKSQLLEKGWMLEKIHSIRRLTCLAADYRIKLAIAEQDLDFIDSIYRGRYPAEEGLMPLGQPTAEDAARSLAIARSVFGQLPLFRPRPTRKQLKRPSGAKSPRQ